MLDRPALRKLFRYGCALTRDEDAAYDLLQDALEISLRKTPRNSGSAVYYVQRIMRNRYIDQYRRNQRHPSVSFEEVSNEPVNLAPQPLEDLVIAEHEVEALLAALEPLERELLFLWAVEGLTAQEIADRTDSPRGSVLSRIHRTRQKVIKLRGGPGGTLAGDAT